MRTRLVKGLICDGSGAEPFRGDILIEDGIISAVGDTGTAAADTEYDCTGKLITPGFIDTHRHCDIAAVTDREFGVIELSQGITSVLCGNCGLAPFPSAKETAGRYYGFLE
ncbi:MAG: hypothetical protein LBR47_04210, partial [Spirochaetaceae bacterium]|nr:hypothetical protein [Spirochaetaceae bacterium]